MKGFKRLSLQINGEGVAKFSIPFTEIEKWNSDKHQWILYNGDYKIIVANNSADEKLIAVITLEE